MKRGKLQVQIYRILQRSNLKTFTMQQQKKNNISTISALQKSHMISCVSLHVNFMTVWGQKLGPRSVAGSHLAGCNMEGNKEILKEEARLLPNAFFQLNLHINELEKLAFPSHQSLSCLVKSTLMLEAAELLRNNECEKFFLPRTAITHTTSIDVDASQCLLGDHLSKLSIYQNKKTQKPK